ncbi:MAG TPA: hypothetical protein VGC51_01185 [Hansschlegelia sp.]
MQQRRLAGLNLRRFAKLWDVEVDSGRELTEHLETPSASWQIEMRSGDARVSVVYEILRWDDLVARDFAVPLAHKFLQGFGTLWLVVTSGLLWRLWRTAPWYAGAWLYPIAVFIGAGALGAAGGSLVEAGAVELEFEEISALLGVATWALSWLGLLHLLRRSGGFVVHLMDDGRSQLRYARQKEADLHDRVDAFADRIRAVVQEGAADEVLVVGHSSGSFLAIDAVSRAYEAEPGFSHAAPSFALLTVGATELMVALHPAAGWFRDRIRRLAVEPALFWAEVVGPWDALNFPRRDPVSELGLQTPPDRPNPVFRRAFLTKMLKPATIKSLRRGIKVFRLHFQFIMANEVQGPYDYFGLVCGPHFARTQFARTAIGGATRMSPHLQALGDDRGPVLERRLIQDATL